MINLPGPFQPHLGGRCHNGLCCREREYVLTSKAERYPREVLDDHGDWEGDASASVPAIATASAPDSSPASFNNLDRAVEQPLTAQPTSVIPVTHNYIKEDERYVWSMKTQKKKVSDSDNTEYLATN